VKLETICYSDVRAELARLQARYDKLVITANRLAFEFNGSPDCCIPTSLALSDVLRWPRLMRVGPLAVRLSEKFWAEHGSVLVRTNGCEVRFSPHPRQNGFANAGDARPSHWKPLADQILHAARHARIDLRAR
jgi:hypothetical protein